MVVVAGGNFVPCHYHTNVCKISRLCKAISSLSLEVSSLNLVSYCKLPPLSPGLLKLRRGFRRVDEGGGGESLYPGGLITGLKKTLQNKLHSSDDQRS